MGNFQIATWYDTWNALGLQNLVDKKVPLNYATRYNLAFANLVQGSDKSYNIQFTGQYAADVKQQIEMQSKSSVNIYVGIGDTGIIGAVADNISNDNRSSNNIAQWLSNNGYDGICIDSESMTTMLSVPTFVSQLGKAFRPKGLGIAVSVPWPKNGPSALYGPTAVNAFNNNVQYLELQDYSSPGGTPATVPVWLQAGIKKEILMGGVSTENGPYQTALSDVIKWTEYAINEGIAGMFSWRLDNDHGSDGQHEDYGPTFTGAQTVYNTVND